jgi:hypothetical protein
MRNFVRRFIEHFRTGDRRRDEEIRTTEGGFEAFGGGEFVFRVAWASVEEILAYKQDRWVVDSVRLVFRTSDAPMEYEVAEETAGYEQLVAAMERAFPDHDKQWWSKVAFPPMETCRTRVWTRPAGPPEVGNCSVSVR